MKNLVLYVHGKGGSAAESEHYKSLFPGCEVTGLDYQTSTPWETGEEIRQAVEKLKNEYERIILIANSIGAFFSMNAPIDTMIRKAYFISPIVNMERLIRDMMAWASVTEAALEAKGVIPTSFGEDLSWKYLCYVREHPVQWNVPTEILYGRNDDLTSYETVAAFGSDLTQFSPPKEGCYFYKDSNPIFISLEVWKCSIKITHLLFLSLAKRCKCFIGTIWGSLSKKSRMSFAFTEPTIQTARYYVLSRFVIPNT